MTISIIALVLASISFGISCILYISLSIKEKKQKKKLEKLYKETQNAYYIFDVEVGDD